MRATKRLRMPCSEEDVRALSAGDLVSLDGDVVITAGLPTHQRLVEHLRAGEPLPLDLEGAAFLHLGGFSEVDGETLQVRYINPTTSTRFNPFMPELIRGFGLRVTGGKGGLDAECASAMAEAGCVYLSFIGGGCTLLSRAIEHVKEVHWREMPIHYRLAKLRVSGLGPATVAIDSHGRSLYAEARASAENYLNGLRER